MKRWMLGLIFLLSLLLLACNATIYVPNSINTPMLKERNQLNLSAHYGVNDFEVQSAFALSNHIGLMYNHAFTKEKSSDEYVRQNVNEVGLGLYKAFPKGLIMEIYGGYGYASMHSYSETGDLPPIFPIKTKADNELSDKMVGDYEKYFIQPTIGVSRSGISVALSGRVSRIKYIDYEWMNPSNWDAHGDFFEPALTVKIGNKVKIVGQIGLSFSMNDNFGEYDYRIGSLGVEVSDILFKK